MRTLLTHEWLRTRSMLGAVTGIAALVVGVSILMVFAGWPVVADFGFLIGLVTILVLTPALQLLLTVDFWRSGYSRTGYFTHSLPVRGGNIYSAKLTWAFVVTVAGLLVSLGLGVAFWPAGASLFGTEANPFVVLGHLWAQLTAVAPTAVLIGGLVLLVAMYLVWPIQYYFSVSIGSEGRLNRLGLGGPIVIFVGLYMVSQVILVISMFAIPVGLDLESDPLALAPFNLLGDAGVMPLGMFPAILLIAAICLVRTVWSWNRKISLA